MRILIALIVAISCANAQTCMSSNNNECLTSMPNGLQSFLATGNPCFLYNNKRWCFSNTKGSMDPCTCTPECGCDNITVLPSCDNSVVPKNPDCSSDQATYCPIGKTNTMCQYCGVNTANCGSVCMRGLNDTEIQLVVDTHNNLRRNVAKGLEKQGVNGGQPQAADMYQLSWDPALATMAQRWTDQCVPGHDTDRNTVGYTYVGQNYASNSNSGQSSDKSLASLVMQWYNEVKDWPSANINKYTSAGSTGVTGHYTQVVWGSTKKIGCGYIGNKAGGWYNNILICNYGEGGNMMNSPVYTIGDTGSKCPNGNNDGLCL